MSTFKKVGGPKVYFKYKECEEGQVLVEEGKFLGTSKSKFDKDNFDFAPVDGGPTVCLNHSGHLKWLIDEHVKVGDVCRVIYTGQEVLDKGPYAGKPSHQFEVLVAEGGEQLELPVNESASVKDDSKAVDLSDLD